MQLSSGALFLASLATCAGLYVLAFCQARGLSTEGLHMEQNNSFDARGQLRQVHIAISLPRDFPEKYVNAACAAAGGCKVKKALGSAPEVLVDAVRH